MPTPMLPVKYRNIDKLLRDLRKEPEIKWIRAGERRALKLFHEMAERVPAYKDFLRRHKIRHAKIRTITDFKEIPTLDKDNYLRRYSFEKLCWDGKFDTHRWTISTTSGSTGEPFYFPRELSQDLQYAAIAELYLRTNFQIDQQSTLYVNAFPMGPWIGGVFTYEIIRIIAERGKYPLSTITPGIQKQSIIDSIKKLGPHFDQVIVGAYGPFLKDALDDGIEEGMKWKNYNLKFVFSAEGFTEGFRDYVIDKASLRNQYRDTLNHYGTVDQGTLAYETPLAVLIRRLAVQKQKTYNSVFPVKHKLPTLCQYDPEMFFFEEVGGGLLCSSYSGLPLVRYDLKDHGGVMRYEDLINRIETAGVDVIKEAKKKGIQDTVWRLPFVYVYERSDFSVSLYAFQIYPETIRKAVQMKKFHSDVTGKFSMRVRFDKNQDQYLEINVELKKRKRGSKKLEYQLRDAVVRRLLAENSEYKKTHSEIPDRVQPKIVFWPYEDHSHFRPGGKQKWVKK